MRHWICNPEVLEGHVLPVEKLTPRVFRKHCVRHVGAHTFCTSTHQSLHQHTATLQNTPSPIRACTNTHTGHVTKYTIAHHSLHQHTATLQNTPAPIRACTNTQPRYKIHLKTVKFDCSDVTSIQREIWSIPCEVLLPDIIYGASNNSHGWLQGCSIKVHQEYHRYLNITHTRTHELDIQSQNNAIKCEVKK